MSSTWTSADEHTLVDILCARLLRLLLVQFIRSDILHSFKLIYNFDDAILQVLSFASLHHSTCYLLIDQQLHT